MLSYAHAHPLGSVELGEGFPRVPTIPDLSPLTVFSSGRDPQVQSSSLEKKHFSAFSLAIAGLAVARVENFYVFGCGWWYDREIVLLPPLCEYRERL